MELRVAIRIFDERERRHLNHILSLAGQRGKVRTLIGPATEADVIFLKKDEPGASFFVQAGRAQQLPLAVFYDTEPQGHDWCLRKPATSVELMPLLESLWRAVSALPRAQQALPEAAVLASPSTLIPTVAGQALLECLLAQGGSDALWHVQLDADDHLVIDVRQHLVYVSPRYLKRLPVLFDVLMLLKASDYVAMSATELAGLRLCLDGENALVRIPWEQFAWAACQHAEPLLPLPQSILETPFRLRRWPSFTRLNHTITHMQWSGALMRGASSLAQLSDWGGNLTEAAKFYNACMVSGLVDVEAAFVAPAPVPESRERSGIFQRILQRLRA